MTLPSKAPHSTPTTPHHLLHSFSNTANQMVSLDVAQATSKAVVEPISSSPRISFSSDFLDEKDFITISPKAHIGEGQQVEKGKTRNPDFEFLSSNSSANHMITADELFFEGKLLPFWQIQHSERLNRMSLKTKDNTREEESEGEKNKEENRVTWFVDDDPSPRPPKCTVLWKELLKLKKHQRASSLSPSSSSSSSSSSSLSDVDEGKEGSRNGDKHVKRIKKGLERTRSASVRIRPMVNVPICTQGRSSVLPPLFPLKKGRLDR